VYHKVYIPVSTYILLEMSPTLVTSCLISVKERGRWIGNPNYCCPRCTWLSTSYGADETMALTLTLRGKLYCLSTFLKSYGDAL